MIDPETMYIKPICTSAKVTETSNTEQTKLHGIWTPQQLAVAANKSRQSIVDAINGKGAYPGRLYAQKIGQLWIIPDAHAANYLDWQRTGELLEEPPIPKKLYWGTKEIADAAGLPLLQVERAVVGIKAGKGKYIYPPTLSALRLGQYWLIRATDAEQYIQEKKQNRDREGGK
jgi:hypothetical protein